MSKSILISNVQPQPKSFPKDGWLHCCSICECKTGWNEPINYEKNLWKCSKCITKYNNITEKNIKEESYIKCTT